MPAHLSLGSTGLPERTQLIAREMHHVSASVRPARRRVEVPIRILLLASKVWMRGLNDRPTSMIAAAGGRIMGRVLGGPVR